MVKITDFNTPGKPTWCPGCGNFGILMALKQAMVELNLEPQQIFISSGIGCSGMVPHHIWTYGAHGLHGRTLPLATGVRLANTELTVIAVAGDGDGYGIGAAHFVHAMKRNLDILFLVHNNMVYGLTTGQTSPTSMKGFKTKSTPMGNIEIPMNPIALAIASGATFVARGYAGDIPHLRKMIVDGVRHRGFALLDVFQPCVTFNKINTYEFWKARIYKLEDTNHNPGDKNQAWLKAQENGDRIPIGLFYREERATYEDELPQIAKIPLYRQSIENVDISQLIEEFT